MSKVAMGVIAGTVLIAALVVVGCGGGGDSSSTTAAPLTKAQFVKQANAICTEGKHTREERFAEATADAESLSNAEKEDLVTKAFAEPYGESIEGLQELGPPKGEEQKVEGLIAAMEKALKELEAAPLKGLSSVAMFEGADKLANGYGLDSCVV